MLDTWRALPEADREAAVILTPHWVFAAPIEYYERDGPRPPVVSPHNAYAFWTDEVGDRDVALAVGTPKEKLASFFDSSELLHIIECHACATFRLDLPIHLARGPVRRLLALLEEWRSYDIKGVAQLSSAEWWPEDPDPR